MTLRGVMTGGNDQLGGASNTVTLNMPPGCQPGDIAVFITASNLGGAGSSIIGTTPTCTMLHGVDTIGSNNAAIIYMRLLTADDIALGTISAQWSQSGRVLAAGDVWYGLDPANPIINYSAITSTPGNLPTVNTTSDNAQVIALASSRVGSGDASIATYPAGYTLDNSSVTKFSSGSQIGCSIAHRTTTGPAGTYGGGQVSWSGAFTSANTYVMALNPIQVAPSGNTKVYIGGLWVPKPSKVYVGGAWVEKPMVVT